MCCSVRMHRGCLSCNAAYLPEPWASGSTPCPRSSSSTLHRFFSRQQLRAVRPCRFWLGEEVSSDVVISDVKYDSILLSQGPFREYKLLGVGITRGFFNKFSKLSVSSGRTFDKLDRFCLWQLSQMCRGWLLCEVRCRDYAMQLNT